MNIKPTEKMHKVFETWATEHRLFSLLVHFHGPCCSFPFIPCMYCCKCENMQQWHHRWRMYSASYPLFAITPPFAITPSHSLHQLLSNSAPKEQWQGWRGWRGLEWIEGGWRRLKGIEGGRGELKNAERVDRGGYQNKMLHTIILHYLHRRAECMLKAEKARRARRLQVFSFVKRFFVLFCFRWLAFSKNQIFFG